MIDSVSSITLLLTEGHVLSGSKFGQKPYLAFGGYTEALEFVAIFVTAGVPSKPLSWTISSQAIFFHSCKLSFSCVIICVIVPCEFPFQLNAVIVPVLPPSHCQKAMRVQGRRPTIVKRLEGGTGLHTAQESLFHINVFLNAGRLTIGITFQ